MPARGGPDSAVTAAHTWARALSPGCHPAISPLATDSLKYAVSPLWLAGPVRRPSPGGPGMPTPTTPEQHQPAPADAAALRVAARALPATATQTSTDRRAGLGLTASTTNRSIPIRCHPDPQRLADRAANRPTGPATDRPAGLDP